MSHTPTCLQVLSLFPHLYLGNKYLPSTHSPEPLKHTKSETSTQVHEFHLPASLLPSQPRFPLSTSCINSVLQKENQES